ncbi:hypothetical protein RDV84_16430 [Lysobacter yananisis]|uniref:Uncharacterized protein n=1 Tax=Lysobacter yananisis TaxID=1003114 RepID=A0ABY9P3K2_9GAMM|nr:hypothetical protein [Lysobacter yananisis]WMT01562.1 hypothetical protein RDV84_16430 [Lysobacter yananisis]
MTDEQAPARAATDRERSREEPAECLLLARFLAELDACADAIDAALHFDDRAAVKPGYDRLMRVAAAYRDRWPRRPCASAQTADADACREAVAAAEAVAAVLDQMSAGVSSYQGLAGELARARARLAAALAHPDR